MSLRVQTDVDPALEPLAPKNRAIRHGTSVTLGSDLNDPPIVYRLTSRFPMKLYLTVIAVVLLTSCSEPSAPEPGSIRVSISTAGGDQDQNGYRVLIGSERVQAIATQGSILIENIPAGTHALTMDGIADNCVLAGPQSRPVTVESVSIAEVAFEVGCALTGIEVTTRTTGFDPPNNYPVEAAAQSHFAATNGTLLLTRLIPGSHTVSVKVPSNCSVAGNNQLTVIVANRVVTPVAFDVTCLPTEKSILFVRDTLIPGNHFSISILAIGVTGSSATYLGEGHSPEWSPGGQHFTYSTARCDYYYYDCYGGLSEMDVNSRATRIVENGSLGDDPAWSRDGSNLAFIRLAGYGGFATLHIARNDGSPGAQVAIPPLVGALGPSWSADGKRIAFHCYGQDGNQICVINADGTGLVRLTAGLNA